MALTLLFRSGPGLDQGIGLPEACQVQSGMLLIAALLQSCVLLPRMVQHLRRNANIDALAAMLSAEISRSMGSRSIATKAIRGGTSIFFRFSINPHRPFAAWARMSVCSMRAREPTE
jgi:hypothetical protein